ncbi:MAG: DUF6777 domain-containing protein [Armatimonadota bacterium]|nr:hypothetical protein [bacterium]
MTKRIPLSVVTVLAATVLISGAVTASERTPAGSFLKYRATTVNQLANQVSNDSSVRAMYARHFQTTQNDVLTTIKDDLKLVTLKSPLRVQTWYVTSSGRMARKTKVLPKGSYVFATNDGTPLLAWSCGNPLRASIPARMAKKTAAFSDTVATQPKPKPAIALNVPPEPDVQAMSVETKVLPNPAETIAAAAVTVPPGFVTEAVPAMTVAEPVAAAPIAAVAAIPVASAMPPIAIGGGSGLGWLGGLAGLAGGLAIAGGGGSNDPLVPEPASLMVLISGAGVLVATLKRSRARR